MAKVKKLPNQDLFTFILFAYGNLIYTDRFLEENNIKDISEFNNAPIGTIYDVTIDKEPIINKLTVLLKTNREIKDPYNGKFKSYIQQNLFDYILTRYGNLDSISDFIGTNGLESIGDFESNKVYTVRNAVENRVIAYYRALSYQVVTGELVSGADFNEDFNIDFLT